MRSFARAARVALAAGPLVALVLAAGCGGSKGSGEAASPGRPCTAKDDVKHAGRTGLEGAKTGVTTAGEGLKTFGKATAGLVEGGSDEASSKWKEGKADTKATAKDGAAKTRDEAHASPCP